MGTTCGGLPASGERPCCLGQLACGFARSRLRETASEICH